MKEIHEIENILPEDIKMEINFDSGINELFEELRQNINHLHSIVSHLHDSEDKLERDFR